MRLIILLLIISGIAFQVHAANENQNFSVLISQSEMILKAKVIETNSRWISNEFGNHIYTTVTLKANTIIKGNLSENPFTVELIGGTVNEITEFVTHSNSFHKDEEVILFLKSHPIRIIGGLQGKYTVYDRKINLENNEISIDVFIDHIQKFLLNPTNSINFDTNLQLNINSNSLIKNKDLEQQKEPLLLKIDKGIFENEAVHRTQNKPELKIESFKKSDEEVVTVQQKQAALKINMQSLKSNIEGTTPDRAQLKFESAHIQESPTTVKNVEKFTLKVEEKSENNAAHDNNSQNVQLKIELGSQNAQTENNLSNEQIKLNITERYESEGISQTQPQLIVKLSNTKISNETTKLPEIPVLKIDRGSQPIFIQNNDQKKYQLKVSANESSKEGGVK